MEKDADNAKQKFGGKMGGVAEWLNEISTHTHTQCKASSHLTRISFYLKQKENKMMCNACDLSFFGFSPFGKKKREKEEVNNIRTHSVKAVLLVRHSTHEQVMT